MDEDLVAQAIELPRGELRVLQPRESAELPDAGGVEWAPLVPYWSVLWRSGVALARELAHLDLRGTRVVELGCGLGVPSIVAACGGADVLATDESAEALQLLERNAAANGATLRTAVVDWTAPATWPAPAFDLAVGADVLYEPRVAPAALALLSRLAPEIWLADPGRPGARLIMEAGGLEPIETRSWGVVRIHHLTAAPRPANRSPAG
jgi:predicted nicotinamide N-methyase